MKKYILITALAVFAACGGRNAKTAKAQATEKLSYRVVAVYPHDPTSYTQGLFFHGGKLWESTGRHGLSRLMEVDLDTGRAVRSADVEQNYFGEGAASVGGRIFQLTWQDGVVLAWNPATLQVTERFDLPQEGWGLTTDGTLLYMSDGTSRLTVVDPAAFTRKRQINVRAGSGGGVQSLNELEWVDGKIWANVYMTDRIAVIDPATGHVDGVLDLSGLLSKGYPDGVVPASVAQSVDVLNGIAHDPATGRLLVTGKLWPWLFEIEIVREN